MKATVFSVFKSMGNIVPYWYHNTKKCKDDNEAVSKHSFSAPMMEIRMWKERFNPLTESKLEVESHKVFATPEIINKYTGFDLFDSQCRYKFEGKVLDIEFEWEEIKYPYIKTYHPRDFIETSIYKIPKILKMEEPQFDW